MVKTLFTFNFKKLPKAALIAIALISGLYFIELFVLPIDSLGVYKFHPRNFRFLSGDFYPNMKVSMTDTGSDLAQHTKYAIKKKVDWETDRYGYRKRDLGTEKFQIIILGESNIAGSGLTQEDMLSEVLERRLKMNVYPLTDIKTPPINIFLNDKRFIDNPPRIVILAIVERYIELLPKPHINNSNTQPFKLELFIRRYLDKHPALGILIDRMSKNSMMHSFVRRIELGIENPMRRLLGMEDALPPGSVQSTVDKKRFFFREVVDRMACGKDVSSEELDGMAEVIASYDRIFKEKGIRFIFLPIPNKENIYYKYVPVKNLAKPEFLGRLILKLQNMGIEVIDTQKAFDEVSTRSNKLLYCTNDTHWNAAGVALTADLVEDALKK